MSKQDRKVLDKSTYNLAERSIDNMVYYLLQVPLNNEGFVTPRLGSIVIEDLAETWVPVLEERISNGIIQGKDNPDVVFACKCMVQELYEGSYLDETLISREEYIQRMQKYLDGFTLTTALFEEMVDEALKRKEADR